MRRPFCKSLMVALLAGFAGASLATPAAADGWGWGGHRGWGHRHWRGDHRDDGGAAAAAALGGFALGAAVGAVAQQPQYGAPYDDCHFVDRPVTDDWGQIIEYRRTEVCD